MSERGRVSSKWPIIVEMLTSPAERKQDVANDKKNWHSHTVVIVHIVFRRHTVPSAYKGQSSAQWKHRPSLPPTYKQEVLHPVNSSARVHRCSAIPSSIAVRHSDPWCPVELYANASGQLLFCSSPFPDGNG